MSRGRKYHPTGRKSASAQRRRQARADRFRRRDQDGAAPPLEAAQDADTEGHRDGAADHPDQAEHRLRVVKARLVELDERHPSIHDYDPGWPDPEEEFPR